MLAFSAALLMGAVAAARPDALGRRTILLGHSRAGRPIVAIETGDFRSARKELVVGCIHGTECAGIAIARRLERMKPPADLDLWIVPNLNPDGSILGRRGNADRVDLNRNFPWRWQKLSGLFDSGPRPLSEPETRIAVRLIERVRPEVSIWFHQHQDLVDDSEGSIPVEWAFAVGAGMRMFSLVEEPGSAVTWETHCLRGATAFVVELPPGRLDPAQVYGAAHGVIAASEAGLERRPSVASDCA
ncbi:MAG TPA: M14 family zinc carboxypeptidase [Gaiellaceae bacterium]|nr:M14 family zinc carboxypeptidase [Gaiellaceae bacterium]